jgi:hypothetical protein
LAAIGRGSFRVVGDVVQFCDVNHFADTFAWVAERNQDIGRGAVIRSVTPLLSTASSLDLAGEFVAPEGLAQDVIDAIS